MFGKKILLVDDDSACLDLMQEVLEDKFTLKLAENGEKALEIAGEFKPDLVILDVMMPGIDGFETCKLLLDGAPSGKPKIVFVSGAQPTLGNQIEINTNGYGFLMKPFRFDDLYNQIEGMLAV